MNNQNELDDATLDKAIDQAISFDGSPVTEHDRRVMNSSGKNTLKIKKHPLLM